MEDSKIAEIRGVAYQQNLDPDIAETDVLKAKLKEFGNEGDAYIKKEADMKHLTRIEEKLKQNQELDLNDLRFIYEIDSKI